MYNTAEYRPVFQRTNFQPAFGRYASRYMGQGAPPATTTAPVPVPTPAAPMQKMSTPVLLGIGAGGGALLGYLITMAMPKIVKKYPKAPGMKTAGAVGGLIGGLAGAVTVLALKD